MSPVCGAQRGRARRRRNEKNDLYCIYFCDAAGVGLGAGPTGTVLFCSGFAGAKKSFLWPPRIHSVCSLVIPEYSSSIFDLFRTLRLVAFFPMDLRKAAGEVWKGGGSMNLGAAYYFIGSVLQLLLIWRLIVLENAVHKLELQSKIYDRFKLK
jgi:hypothetical protein